VGEAPKAGGAALLIIDMVNDMAFEGADAMLEPVLAAAEIIAALRGEADRRGIPVIFVNDNYGQWRSERSEIMEHCRQAGGSKLLERLAPRADDYFVIKPQVSGFFASNLPALLESLGATRLVLTGMAADICVLFTAADAHMRGHALWIPEDGVASSSSDHKAWALQLMRKSQSPETRSTEAYTWTHWLDAAKAG
jgi:nicotinamidase-related amidase